MTPEFSPSGKLVCQSSGPLDAELVWIGESPAFDEMHPKDGGEPRPFLGRAGKLLTVTAIKAGLDRDRARIINIIPVRPDKDKFANHDERDFEWARERFRLELHSLSAARVFVPLGANPTEWLIGGKLPVAQRGERHKEGFIQEWRGSIIPIASGSGAESAPEDYVYQIAPEVGVLNKDAAIIPTFHPAAILRQFTWHPWFVQDLKLASKILREGVPKNVYRTWYRNDVGALRRLASSGVDLIAVDTELDPWIIGIATEDEVHVFEWNPDFEVPLRLLLESPRILKVAHNWLFDYAFFRKNLGIEVAKPYFDSMGGAHILNNALQKELSPHISTRFTNWPYHKWLVNVDPFLYNGMDSIVCYDSYWPIIEQLGNRELIGVATHDHRLFTPLLDMQAVGFRIDEGVRADVEKQLEQELVEKTLVLQADVSSIIEEGIGRFEKPHLFRKLRKCDCCGGGKKQREHCWSCAGLPKKPKKWEDYLYATNVPEAYDPENCTIKQCQEMFPICGKCLGTGKVTIDLPFNPDSPDQVADVLYRGLKIKARKYKGNETVKAANLDSIRGKHPLVEKLVEISEVRADYDTVARLRSGQDGRLHCEFDPFGTGAGRVAGKEGLLEAGTNPMNLPKEARRFVIPSQGKIFLYPDKSQIEARAVAVLSGDKALKAALLEVIPDLSKPDSHTWLVRELAKHGIVVTRDQSKRISYAGFYGVSAAQLAQELTAESFRKGSNTPVTTDEATIILDVLFKIWSDVKLWQNEVLTEVLRTRRLRCKFTGRERTWAGYILDTKTQELTRETKKQVWSYLPQHMAAWVLGEALIWLYYDSGEWGKLVQPLIHVHDALLTEVPIERLEEGKALMMKAMTQNMWGMEFPSAMKVGKNWYECS